ncbi:hypothetical protein [Clostridium felsineum]|uniref:hypothetical protein n=1 Tax=Clostridium felsineum TaxID=36839 RepID=UPI00098CC8DD|nr:hypothetical protein [Clostridium felsineum]
MFNLSHQTTFSAGEINLNTSYVNVQHFNAVNDVVAKENLNTSYVNVQQFIKVYGNIPKLKFKYILC